MMLVGGLINYFISLAIIMIISGLLIKLISSLITSLAIIIKISGQIIKLISSLITSLAN